MFPVPGPGRFDGDERHVEDVHADSIPEKGVQVWINRNLHEGGATGTLALAIKISLELVLAGDIVGVFLALGHLTISWIPGVSFTPDELVRALAVGAVGIYSVGTNCHYSSTVE